MINHLNQTFNKQLEETRHDLEDTSRLLYDQRKNNYCNIAQYAFLSSTGSSRCSRKLNLVIWGGVPQSQSDLGGTNVTTIGNDVFANETQLIMISIRENRVSYLPHNLIHRNLRLKQFYAHKNKIRRIDADFFRYNQHLELVEFHYNQLKFLPANLFTRNGALKTINFSRNLLKKLPMKFLIFNTELTNVLVQNNNITEVSRFILGIDPQKTEAKIGFNDCNQG